jgi:hypothetical protein
MSERRREAAFENCVKHPAALSSKAVAVSIREGAALLLPIHFTLVSTDSHHSLIRVD